MIKEKTTKKKTKANLLWEWARARDVFTASEAADDLDILYDTVIHYLRFWRNKKAMASVSTRKREDGQAGRPEVLWQCVAKDQPPIWPART